MDISFRRFFFLLLVIGLPMGFSGRAHATVEVEARIEIQTSPGNPERLIFEKVRVGKLFSYFAKVHNGIRSRSTTAISKNQFDSWEKSLRDMKKSARRPSCAVKQELVFVKGRKKEVVLFCPPSLMNSEKDPVVLVSKQIRKAIADRDRWNRS